MMWLMKLLDEGEGPSITSELGFTENKIRTIDSINLDNSVTRSRLSADHE